MTRMRSTSNSSAQAQNAARPSNGTPGDFNMRAGKAVSDGFPVGRLSQGEAKLQEVGSNPAPDSLKDGEG